MNDLAELLAIAPRRAPFTSDDPCAFAPIDPMRFGNPDTLIGLATIFRFAYPRGTWREFTRWLARGPS